VRGDLNDHLAPRLVLVRSASQSRHGLESVVEAKAMSDDEGRSQLTTIHATNHLDECPASVGETAPKNDVVMDHLIASEGDLLP
jgi:hypothetical protein